MTSLGKFSALSEGQSKSFTFKRDGKSWEMFIVRHQHQIYGYVNSCPHARAPLDWQPDHFLDDSGQYIQCANHLALFSIKDGACVSGPCRRQRLTAVDVQLHGDEIQLHETIDP